jgi:hypothetical protein
MANKTPSRKPTRPTLVVPQDLETTYVNLVRIAHAPSEMVFEFGHAFPGNPRARVKSRLLMSPLSAKLFHRALTENLAKYENTYGEISVPGDKVLEEYSKLFQPPEATGEGDEKEQGEAE